MYLYTIHDMGHPPRKCGKTGLRPITEMKSTYCFQLNNWVAKQIEKTNIELIISIQTPLQDLYLSLQLEIKQLQLVVKLFSLAASAILENISGCSGSSTVPGVTGSSQAMEEVVNGTWRLHIRQLKESDRDCYMCQINTSPMISELGCLDILVLLKRRYHMSFMCLTEAEFLWLIVRSLRYKKTVESLRRVVYRMYHLWTRVIPHVKMSFKKRNKIFSSKAQCLRRLSLKISKEKLINIISHKHIIPPDIVYGGDTSADLAVSEGDNATLSCRATGRPTPRVSWRREDGEPILIRASSAGISLSVKKLSPSQTKGRIGNRTKNTRQEKEGRCKLKRVSGGKGQFSKKCADRKHFLVAPVVKAPNQLLGAPLSTDVQLECYVEAFPNTINYWVKNRRGSEDEMLLEGLKYSVREERSGYKVLMWLLIKGFTEQDVKKDVGSYKCVSTNSLGKADGTLRLYEIKIGFDRSSRGKDHVSIIGGLAEAAQSSGANSGGRGLFGCWKKLEILQARVPGRTVITLTVAPENKKSYVEVMSTVSRPKEGFCYS
ncbi:Lachesin [Melipona quadrifasciata]|uniref:Lachesin n=1 Tax=Melipona quadrifasciata TaxID=166423 RepID=A0A0N0BHD4_9HYME|nr:Lachesin [Melipona quadrifasciata]